MASKVYTGTMAIDCKTFTDQYKSISLAYGSFHARGATQVSQKPVRRKLTIKHLLGESLSSYSRGFWCSREKPCHYIAFWGQLVSCHYTSRRIKAAECTTKSKDCVVTSSNEHEDEQDRGSVRYLSDEQALNGSTYSNQGLAEACRFVYNDAKFVNERARNDITLLTRGITRLNDRARQDVAFLGLEFLKLDARARENTEKIDHRVKEKAAHLHHIATILKNKAHSKLKTAADKHWSDGALEADLRRADFVVKRRAMEDAYMALKFVRNIHDIMANKLQEQLRKQGPFPSEGGLGSITLEKNGRALDLLSGEVTTGRIAAIQEAYWSMASALSEADGIDYTDPEELELLVTTLIDLDAMDGKSSVSLLAECSSSSDVNTRQALANALAAAPSMWILGNAGMGALQRLAQDSNPAVAAAASKAITELQQQWELEDGDSLRFIMNQHTEKKGDETV